jgi:hypothetical protein
VKNNWPGPKDLKKLVSDKAYKIADTKSWSGNVITLRLGYFYTNGNDVEKFSNVCLKSIKAAAPDASIIDKGNQWKAFRGGDSVAKGSHFWCKIKVPGVA